MPYTKRLPAPILFAVFLLIAGCAFLHQESRETRLHADNAAVAADAFHIPSGSYYYYLAAQRMIKKHEMSGAVRFLEEAVLQDPETVLLKQELALVYIQAGRKDDALALCEEILEIRPGHVEALIIAGSIRQSMGDIEAARTLYERVIENAPDRKNIYLVLGRLYFQDDLHADAVNVFQRLVERFPDAYVGYYYLGMAFAGSGDKDRAIAAFSRAVEIEPGFAEARFELINIYDDMDDRDKIIDIYEDIVRDDPDDISAAIALGLLYLKNDYEWKADALFERLGLMAGIDRSVIDTVVQDLISQNRYEEAVSVIEGMLKGLPEDDDLHYLAGISEYLIDNFDGALFHLRRVGLESRFYVDAVLQKAVIYNREKQRMSGIRVLEEAFENAEKFREPDRIRVARFLGAFYIDEADFQGAIGVLTQAVEMDPDNTDLHYDLGVAYDKSGDPENTIAQMKRIIHMDPEHADALNYLGYTYALEGIHLEEAESLIRRALEIKPDSGYILDSMGWVYFKKGDIERAVSYLEKAVEIRPEDPEILDHLGDAYREQGRMEDALAVYRRALAALEANDEHAPAKNNEDRLKIEKKIEALKNR